MRMQFSDDEDLYSGSGQINVNLYSGSGQIIFGNESLNVTNNPVIFNDISFDHNLSNFTMVMASNDVINTSADVCNVIISTCV